MSGLSSKALTIGTPENKKKYNSYERNTDFDINLNESFYRIHDPQLGRFWQIDPKPSDSMSLFAFGYNNPTRYNDPLGDSAILGYNGGAALGLGHQVLLFQDKAGNWFVYSMGGEGNGQRVVSGSNTEGNVFLQAVNHETYPGLPEGSLTVSQITDFLKENKVAGYKLSDPIVINTTQKQDEQIATNAAQSKSDFASGKEKYNLYNNNSTHNAMKVLNTKTGLDLPVTGAPQSTHPQVKEYIKLKAMTPEQRASYIKQKEQETKKLMIDATMQAM